MIFSKMLTGYYNCENKASIVVFNIPRDIYSCFQIEFLIFPVMLTLV